MVVAAKTAALQDQLGEIWTSKSAGAVDVAEAEMRKARLRLRQGVQRMQTAITGSGGPWLLGARMTLAECDRIGDGAVQLVSRVTIEIEGVDKPACVAELVSRYYF